MIYFSNKFPQGDPQTLLQQLHLYSKDKRHPHLAHFLKEATAVVHDKVEKLPLDPRQLVPHFESVQSLAADSTLQRGVLYYKTTPTWFNSSDNTLLAGLGLSLLASTAVSLAQTLEVLPLTGSEVIRIAFRLGSLVTGAYVVHGATPNKVQQELDNIYCRQQTPKAAKVFVSAKGRTSVTVSRPPSRIKELFHTSAFFRSQEYIPLPIYGGLCHAPHVYTQQDAAQVVGSSGLGEELFSLVPVLAPSTGAPFLRGSANQLFKDVDRVIDNASGNLGKEQSQVIKLIVFGTSLPAQDLQTALDRGGVEISVNFRSSQDSKIAIMGISCRLPGGAIDTDTLWGLLEKGLNVHRVIPPSRFDMESHYDAEHKKVNASHTQYSCFVDDPGFFDARFFNISPREAEQTDPMQRLALVTAFEALERAGFVAGRTDSSHAAQASDDYQEVNTAQEISTYFIRISCRAFGPGHINYFLKFSGPSFSCNTARSSSLATIQAACTALWNGEVNTVVAGGMNILTNSDAFASLSKEHFLTKTPNACKTWDIGADSYCRADGVVSFVMKQLEDTEKNNDNILGIILSAATNHSANAVSITHPHAYSQAFHYRKVLERARVDTIDVSYIKAHSTGTQAGDIQELTSLTDVFAPLSTKRQPLKQPLHIGAVKSNVGHSKAVAGATALLKVLLMFRQDIIPPHMGIKTALNPKLPAHMDQQNLRVPLEATSWPRMPDRKRLAMVNSFSAAGGNTSLLLEEGTATSPGRSTTEADPRPTHIAVISAKSKPSLKGNIERLLLYLEKHPAVSLADLAYTTTAHRQHYNHRLTFHAADVARLQAQLLTSLKQQIDSHRPVSSSLVPSVAFTFTSQGASYKSSNLQLFHHSPMLTLNALAKQLGFPSFISTIDGSHNKDHNQSAEIALAKPDVVLGHSLGEYAALCIAGVISASDAICLADKQAEMLQEKCQAGSHSMLAMRAAVDNIKDAAGDLPYKIAYINSPKGTWHKLDAGHHCATIDVPFAFHSAQTDPALQDFETLAQEGVIFRKPRIPVISPLLASIIYNSKTMDSTYLQKATRETCDFLRAALEIRVINKDMFWIKMGPHSATLGPSCVTVSSLRRREDNWTTLAKSLATLHSAGLEVQWNEFHRPRLRLLDLPTYSWNNKNYWIQYNGSNMFYEDARQTRVAPLSPVVSSFRTSLVQAIIRKEFYGTSGTVTMQSDLMSADFFAAAHGHSINRCSVVTSSIHADIAYTLGDPVKYEHLNIANLKVAKGLVAQINTSQPQLIHVTASTSNINDSIRVEWHNVGSNGAITESEPFTTATVLCSNAYEWLRSWAAITHLVKSRIETLQDMAQKGQATQFSRKMAYSLFASSLVNYTDKYRRIHSVVMHEFKAFADVRLTTEEGGSVWTVPPYFINSVAHLARFVINVTNAHNTVNHFCVTPSWQSMLLARPLMAREQYQSYIKMIPSQDDDGVFFRDMYIMREGEIIGVVGGIQFRRYLRILLSRFFSPPDSVNITAKSVALLQRHSSLKENSPCPASSTATCNKQALLGGTQSPGSTLAALSINSSSRPSSITSSVSKAVRGETPATETDQGSESTPPASKDPSSIVAKATLIIASQTGIDVADLSNNTRLRDVGVDSLMSLVITEMFCRELDITVNSSLFLEYLTLGALKG
ncbi:LOW QUALITY PROTEIN: putative polyketide synthase [Colletotrichum navitas]|uniref:Polyketide synthase n=1 Tax=Colletotrichum navitas TaxID=681940 RepID=A0AAD8PHU1_9PEZI|nr:LOW QUALITY PROTEIN: putative polyketide synthase [Colletotrichum navitas]KAK1561225.1 LOW QUALITY PROTEIN: putative polyketide synthase [Colletotrichum navitas]